MHLVSVTLQGFKSFPERTEIRFHPGVTAIVGPNGSGKSNVTDAIRWVLGEQSAKTLRGSKMEDIIFSGTELRRPLSFAEVVLKLDNNDYSLSIDASEVEVGRRLYRSGESEYTINRQRCRLRDIVDLFMDTGIGREGYSIVGQGRIDEVLSNKSEDRRRIFDEAAGISRYKSRRDEATRKLQATELEQQRAEDLLVEINRQLRPLLRQAEQAKTYLKLQSEFKELDLAMIYREMDVLEKDLTELTKQDAIYTAELRTGKEIQEQLNLRIQTDSQKLSDLEELEEKQLEARDAAVRKLREHQARIDLLQARMEQMREQHASRQARLEHARARLEELTVSKLDQTEVLNATKAKVESNNRELDEQRKVSERVYNKRHQVRQELNEAEKKLQSSREELQDRRHQLRMLEQEAEQSARYEGQLSIEMADINRALAEVHARITETKEQLSEKDSQLAEQRGNRETLSEQLIGLREKVVEAERRVQQAHNNEQQRAYRLQTLESLRQNYEGYHESVRRLLNRIEDPALLSRIYGPLGDLITVAEGYETAIDVALGVAIQNVVVTDSGTAGALINVLKRERLGRVTFLPLANLSTSGLNSDLQYLAERSNGYIGIASDLVSYDQAIESAVRNTLARTVVVRDLRAANDMASASRFRLRIVTLEGEIIMPGGALTGGSRKQRQSLLSRPREIEELQAGEETLARELEAADNQAVKLRDHSVAIREKLETADNRISGLEQDKIRLDAELSQASTEQEKNKTRYTRLEDEASGIRRQRDETASDSNQIRESINILESSVNELTPRIEQLAVLLDQTGKDRDREQEKLQILHAQQSALEAEQKAAGQLAIHYAEEHQQQLEILNSYESEQHEGSAAADQTEEELTLLRSLTNDLDAEVALSNEQREETQSLRRAVAEALDASRAELEQQRSDGQRLELERTRMQARRENRQEKLDATRNRLWEEYELTFANRSEWSREDLSEAPAKKRLTELREEIRKLGTVNVNAVEEQREMTERKEFIEKQIADISDARSELEHLIRQITQSMKDTFAVSFQFIRQEFRAVFIELFNGGEADIVLEDENDVLGSGIDIRVSPPGKKLQNMLLLSGGERCLSAIALIFALQRLRPAPFCILDEVEAALDDSNIFRFNDYVRKQSQNIQFILVTHRKGTMEAADRLYGVTMQEQGVSRMLSLQLT